MTLVSHSAYTMSCRPTCIVTGCRFPIRHAHKGRRTRGDFKVTCLPFRQPTDSDIFVNENKNEN